MYSNMKYLALLVVILCNFPSVMAESKFNYNFFSVSYEQLDEQFRVTIFDSFGARIVSETLDGNGVELDFSYDVFNNIAIVASYSEGSAYKTFNNTAKITNELKSAEFGLVFHTPLTNSLDLLLGTKVINGSSALRIDQFSSSNIDANGNSIFAGARTMITNDIEINGFIERDKIENFYDTTYQIGSLYYINDRYSIRTEYSYADKSRKKSLSIGASLYF